MRIDLFDSERKRNRGSNKSIVMPDPIDVTLAERLFLSHKVQLARIRHDLPVFNTQAVLVVMDLIQGHQVFA